MSTPEDIRAALVALVEAMPQCDHWVDGDDCNPCGKPATWDEGYERFPYRCDEHKWKCDYEAFYAVALRKAVEVLGK